MKTSEKMSSLKSKIDEAISEFKVGSKWRVIPNSEIGGEFDALVTIVRLSDDLDDDQNKVVVRYPDGQIHAVNKRSLFKIMT